MKTYYFIFIFLFTGCSTGYIPSPKNIPLFEKKGEVQIETGVSDNYVFVSGSYAFSKKYALITNGFLAFGNFSEEEYLNDLLYTISYGYLGGYISKNRYVEIGLGRYNLLPSSRWRLEAFAGAGYSMTKQGNEFSQFRKDNRYYQGFTQANISRKLKRTEIGWSLRMAYSDFQFKSFPRHSQEMIYHNFGALHVEPLMFFRFGGKHFHGVVRGGHDFLYPLSSSARDGIYHGKFDLFYVNRMHLSVGLSYRF